MLPTPSPVPPWLLSLRASRTARPPRPAPRFVPYDQAECWSAHHAYFARRGVRAFTDGEVPYFSTSNYASARQHAAMFVAHLEALTAEGLLASDEKVHLLEVGGGLGRFAANFLRALDTGLGAPGRRAAARLCYVYSDYARSTVRDASLGPELSAYVEEGRVLPLVYDCRRPEKLRRLDGTEVDLRFVAVQCNYLCCVLPTKYLRRRDGRWSELLVARSDGAAGDVAELEHRWGEVDLPGLFDAASRPLHAEVLGALLSGEARATLAYPSGFVDFVAGLRPLLRPGALLSLQDYGKVALDDKDDLTADGPRRYGESLNHGVAFPVLDAFARVAGLDLLRTTDPLEVTHHAFLRVGRPFGDTARRAFDELFVQQNQGQDLLDFAAAASRFLAERDLPRAIRYFDRALSLDPYHPEHHLRMGQACVAAGLVELGLSYLEQGQALDLWRVHDFDPGLRDARAALPTSTERKVTR